MVQVLWRRLDVPGHDACRLMETADGYALEGCAAFVESDEIVALRYRVTCDRNWQAQRSHVVGWAGTRSIVWHIAQNHDGVWSLDGREFPELNGCQDLDLGFTPATNLLQLRRIALKPGSAADVPAAWLDTSSTTLMLLTQRYARLNDRHYEYVAPATSYHAVLDVTRHGFVRTYPGLWELERCSEDGDCDDPEGSAP